MGATEVHWYLVGLALSVEVGGCAEIEGMSELGWCRSKLLS